MSTSIKIKEQDLRQEIKDRWDYIIKSSPFCFISEKEQVLFVYVRGKYNSVIPLALPAAYDNTLPLVIETVFPPLKYYPEAKNIPWNN